MFSLEQAALIPDPFLWPLAANTDSFGPEKIETSSLNIGYDPRWTPPTSILGSAIFSGNVIDQESYLDIQSKPKGPLAINEISILVWIKLETSANNKSMTLFDSRPMKSSSSLTIKLVNGVLSMTIPDKALMETLVFTSPGISY